MHSAMSSTSASPACQSIAREWKAAITVINRVRGSSEHGFPPSKAVPQFKAPFHSEPVSRYLEAIQCLGPELGS